MALLARRPYSAARVRDKLAADFTATEADAAVARLLELRMLDDRAYAETVARDRLERGGYGRHRIRRDLLAAGIGVPDADAAIAEVVDEGRERERAASILERFRRRASGDVRRPDAEFRHLVSRGFPAEMVRDLLEVSL